MSLFHIDPRRSGDVVEKLLGKDFSGVVGTDRYSAYKRIPVEQRALCYAHLKRNFQALVDRGGEATSIGRWGIAELGRVFGFWPRCIGDGKVDWQGLQHGLKPIKARFGKLLEYGKSEILGTEEARSIVAQGKLREPKQPGSRFAERMLTVAAPVVGNRSVIC